MESSNQEKKKKRDLERKKKSRSKYRHSTADATPSSSFNQHYGGSSSYGSRLHGVYGSSSMHSHTSILSSSPAASSSVLLSSKLIRHRDGKVEVNCSFLRARYCSLSRDFSTLSKDLSAITKQISLFDLSNNELTSLPPICQSDRVESIALQCNMLKELVISNPINHLMVMNVSFNELTKFPDRRCIECMPLLRQLILNNNHITSIPVESLRALGDINIEVLNMAYNCLTELPSEVELLTALTALDISYNALRELPLSILKLKHLKQSISSLNVRGNVLTSPPQQIAERNGLISIAEHFSAIYNKVDIVYKGCHLKMVVVAHESVDKSSLLKRLERWSALSAASDVPSNHSIRSNTSTNTLYISHRCRRSIYGDLNNNMLDDFTEVIKVNVFDCDGREIYHSASKLLFSQFALHLIVYDVSAVRTIHDCDKYVQFWVDLIQATVPGSSMVIAATHCDLLTEEEISARIEMLKDRLRCNEEFRLADLRREIRACSSSKVRLAALKRLEDMRPFIYDIVSIESSSNSSSQPNADAGVEQLMRTIVHLVTPSSENKHPFNIINIQVPHHYQVVKLHIDEFRSSLGMKLKPFCTMTSLEEQIQRVLEDSVPVPSKGGPHDPSTPIPIPTVKFRSELTPPSSTKREGTMSSGSISESTRNALVYWSGVGEIIQFSSATQRLLTMDDSALEMEDGGDKVYDIDELLDCSNSDSHYQSEGDESMMTGLSFDEINSNYSDEELDDGDSTVAVDSLIILHPSWLTRVMDIVTNRDSVKGFLDKRTSGMNGQRIYPTTSGSNSSSRSDIAVPINNEMPRQDYIFSWPLLREIVLNQGRTGSSQLLGTFLPVSEHTIDAVKSILVRLNLIMHVENLIMKQPLCNASAHEVDLKEDHLEHRLDGMRLSEEDLNAGVWKLVEAVDKDSSICDTHSEPPSSRHIPRRYYLLPGLLSDPKWLSDEDNCSSHMPRSGATTSLQCDLHRQQQANGPFVHQGSIRLERVFTFRRCVPSLLVPRIISRMYSRHNHIVKQYSCTDSLDGRTAAATAIATADLSKCWKSSFIQEHGNCTVWVLLKDATVSSIPRESSNLFSEDNNNDGFRDFDIDAMLSIDPNSSLLSQSSDAESTSPSRVSEPHTDDDDDDDAANTVEEAIGRSSERVKQLKIVCHGHLLDCQSIIEALNDYSRVVQEIILGEYTDPTSCSCHVCTHTVCPVCLLKQFPDELCGSVSIADEQALMSSIQSLVHGRLHTTDSQLLEAYKQWDKDNTVRCMRNGCIIKADFLIQLPPKLVSLLSRCQGDDTVYASMVAYIREAVLSKSSLVQSTRFITITPTEMASSLVRVLQIRVKDKPQYQKFKSALFGRNNNNNNNNNTNNNSNSSPPEEFQMKCERLLSGCKVHVPMALHEVHARLGKRLLTSNTKGDNDDDAHSENFILTSFPTKSDYERQKLQQYFLIGDSQHWLYVARYVNQAELSVDLDDLSGRDDKATSDAVLLEFIAPLKPVPFQRFTSAADITFQLDLGLEQTSSSSSSSLGGKFKSLPLYTDRRRRDQGAEAIRAVGDDDGVVDPPPPVHHGVIDIEHPVQAWGFTTNSSSPDSYWARVVLRSGSFYLVSTYSSHSDEHPTTGGPVLHCTGAVIGVISERLYKKGTQSAHYVATLLR